MILRDVDVWLGAEHRHVVPNRSLADHDAGGVHARVPRQVLERLRRIEQLVRLAVLLVRGLEARLLLERIADRHALPADRLRNHRRDQTCFARRHPHDAPNVAHDAAALELMEGGDLADARLPVFVAHVLNDAVALIHAEVDVEVGHRHALGVQESLEQKPVCDRVQVGDAKRPRNQRAGARTASGAHRHTVVLRPVDEVLNDEEVPGEAHLQNHVELELEPAVVGVLFEGLRRAPASPPCAAQGPRPTGRAGSLPRSRRRAPQNAGASGRRGAWPVRRTSRRSAACFSPRPGCARRG